MKINRLYEITTILLNRQTVTAKELAERFQVSTRTIYRDVDVLSTAGVPVYMNKGKGGGIALLESYALNRTLISEAESESLLLAIKTLQATQYPGVDTALEKISALFKKIPEHDWVEVDFSPWGSLPEEQNKFTEIKRAMLQRKVIRFVYVNGNGQKSIRLAEPEKLLFKGNCWYLSAYCRIRRESRTFRISRLKNLEVTDEQFAGRKKIENPEAAEVSQQSLIKVKLQFQAKALSRLYDYFEENAITSGPDGSCVLEAALPEGEWLYSYILSFGSLVEVIEPTHIRNLITNRLRHALALYEP
ncbi:helix-turn-helix transcriptional regulator [Anaerospora hongkongensis]|uniref:helix-turn-helix transcriptional regulator n=1 Tax=Anaerospora hongkongensis TaxID=244830 RepID=UPI0028A169BD|nr:YafY family protein [Anaerospora hongkongensis]